MASGWFDLSRKRESARVSENTPGYGLQEGDAFNRKRFAARMGSEEWYLAYEVNAAGDIEGMWENTTHSFAFSPEGGVRFRSYSLSKPGSGKRVTVEMDSKAGEWNISRRVLTLRFPDEILRFLVIGVEDGIAMLLDGETDSLSVLMTEAAFREETRD